MNLWRVDLVRWCGAGSTGFYQSLECSLFVCSTGFLACPYCDMSRDGCWCREWVGSEATTGQNGLIILLGGSPGATLREFAVGCVGTDPIALC